MTVKGIPAYDRSGRYVATFLCLLLLGAAIVWGSSRSGGDRGASNREALIQRREKLFAELVDLERERRASADANGRIGDRRKSLIAELEVVYRELARLD